MMVCLQLLVNLHSQLIRATLTSFSKLTLAELPPLELLVATEPGLPLSQCRGQDEAVAAPLDLQVHLVVPHPCCSIGIEPNLNITNNDFKILYLLS